jgi:hypothetical protein
LFAVVKWGEGANCKIEEEEMLQLPKGGTKKLQLVKEGKRLQVASLGTMGCDVVLGNFLLDPPPQKFAALHTEGVALADRNVPTSVGLHSVCVINLRLATMKPRTPQLNIALPRLIGVLLRPHIALPRLNSVLLQLNAVLPRRNSVLLRPNVDLRCSIIVLVRPNIALLPLNAVRRLLCETMRPLPGTEKAGTRQQEDGMPPDAR